MTLRGGESSWMGHGDPGTPCDLELYLAVGGCVVCELYASRADTKRKF